MGLGNPKPSPEQSLHQLTDRISQRMFFSGISSGHRLSRPAYRQACQCCKDLAGLYGEPIEPHGLALGISGGRGSMGAT